MKGDGRRRYAYLLDQVLVVLLHVVRHGQPWLGPRLPAGGGGSTGQELRAVDRSARGGAVGLQRDVVELRRPRGPSRSSPRPRLADTARRRRVGESGEFHKHERVTRVSDLDPFNNRLHHLL